MSAELSHIYIDNGNCVGEGTHDNATDKNCYSEAILNIPYDCGLLR